jgi:hypothetical protein
MHSRTGQHPIMAYLEQGNKLDIKDEYVTTSSSKPATTADRKNEGDEPFEIEPKTCHIDEETKTLIKVTAILVALRNGLSPSWQNNQPLSLHTRSRSQSTPVSCHSSLGSTISLIGSTRKACGSPPMSAPMTPAKFDGAEVSSHTSSRRSSRLPGIPSTIMSDESGERAFLSMDSLAKEPLAETTALPESPTSQVDSTGEVAINKASRWRRIKNYGKRQLSRRRTAPV